MKKLAIGCGIVLLLFGIAGAAAMYYVYRQVAPTIAQFREFAQVPDLERNVTNRASYTPPATGELTEQQIERLVQVQNRVRERLGDRFAKLEQRHKALLEKAQAQAVDLPEIMAVYRGIASAWMDAKRQQIEALNEASFSLEEYRWVRERAYQALGQPFVEIDVTKIIQDIQRGVSEMDPASLKGAIGGDGKDPNAPLVEKFKKFLEQNAALAALGL